MEWLRKLTDCFLGIATLLLAVLLYGCDCVEEVKPEEKGIVNVPISLSVGGGWTVGLGEGPTRNEAYDEDELAGVKEAQIFVFRRPEGSNDDVPFCYDPTNFMIISLNNDLTVDNGGKLNGEGTLYKRPGFEYRVIAISYSSERKTGYEDVIYGGAGNDLIYRTYHSDLQRFYISVEPEMRLDDFKSKMVLTAVKFEDGYWTDFIDGRQGSHSQTWEINEESMHVNTLSGIVADYPRLFHCECYTEYNGTVSYVIPYSFGNDSLDDIEAGGKMDMEVKGALKIGMSKVVIKINNFSSHHYIYNSGDSYSQVKWLSLMSDNVTEDMALAELGVNTFDEETGLVEKYTPICYGLRVANAPLTLTTYLPPMLSHLALRVNCIINEDRMVYYLDNYLIRPEDDVVKDPETGEEIRNTYNDVFYLRPNHKYVIEVEDSEELLKYPIR